MLQAQLTCLQGSNLVVDITHLTDMANDKLQTFADRNTIWPIILFTKISQHLPKCQSHKILLTKKDTS